MGILDQVKSVPAKLWGLTKGSVGGVVKFIAANFWKIVAVIGVAFLIYTVFKKDRQYENLIGLTEQYNQLSKHAAELEVKYQDQKTITEKVKKDWADELGHIKGTKKANIRADFVLNNHAKTDSNADLIYIGKDGKQKYLFHELAFVDEKGAVGPPIGYVMVYEDGHVVSKVYKHHMEVKTLLTKDEDSGRYKVLSKGDYVLEQPGLAHRKGSTKTDWTGVPYPMNIVGGEADIDPTEGAAQAARFRLWDPHVDLGASFGVGTSLKTVFYPSLGATFSSYGRSKNDNTLRFARIGVGGTRGDGIQFNFAPVMYNLGGVTKILSNTFVYPQVSYGLKTGVTYGIGMSLSF